MTVAVLDDNGPAAAAEWRLHAGGLRGDLIDLSLSGAAVELPVPLEVGTRVVLRLESRAHGVTHDVTGRVTRRLPGEGEPRLIVTLDERLCLDQIARFGRHLGERSYV